jgi:predicted phosphodiesterase
MRIALMSDIHANREAFDACLVHARAAGVERHVFLGDFVGYGADPEWVVGTVMELVEDGAIAIAGNHDRAVGIERGGMNDIARRAIDWTRGRLDVAAAAFLARLPLAIEDEDRLYVHADASAPAQWRYVEDRATAAASLAATRQRVTFCGHVHVPMLFDEDGGGPLADGTPAIRLRPTRSTTRPHPSFAVCASATTSPPQQPRSGPQACPKHWPHAWRSAGS